MAADGEDGRRPPRRARGARRALPHPRDPARPGRRRRRPARGSRACPRTPTRAWPAATATPRGTSWPSPPSAASSPSRSSRTPRPTCWPRSSFAARREQARAVGDALLRRTRLGLLAARAVTDRDGTVARRVAKAMAPELGWDERREAAEAQGVPRRGGGRGHRGRRVGSAAPAAQPSRPGGVSTITAAAPSAVRPRRSAARPHAPPSSPSWPPSWRLPAPAAAPAGSTSRARRSTGRAPTSVSAWATSTSPATDGRARLRQARRRRRPRLRLAPGRRRSWQPPERVDARPRRRGRAARRRGVGRRPPRGRLQHAAGVVRRGAAGAATPWTAPQLLGAAGRDPSVDLSINGVAYVDVHRPGARRRRRPRRAPGAQGDGLHRASTRRWTSTRPATRAPARAARGWRSPPTASPSRSGARRGRSSRGASSSTACPAAPQDLTLPRSAARRAARPTLPTSASRTTRASPGSSSASSAAAPRASPAGCVGSQFEPPVALDGGERRGPAARSTISGRGDGYAARRRHGVNGAFGAVLKDDALQPRRPARRRLRRAARPRAGDGYNGDGVVAYTRARAPARRSVRRRHYELDAGLARRSPRPRGRRVLSRPGARPARPGARPRRRGGPRGDPPSRSSRATGDGKLVVAVFDRPPARLSTAWQHPPLRRPGRVVRAVGAANDRRVDGPCGAATVYVRRGGPTACTAGAWWPPTAAGRRDPTRLSATAAARWCASPRPRDRRARSDTRVRRTAPGSAACGRLGRRRALARRPARPSHRCAARASVARHARGHLARSRRGPTLACSRLLALGRRRRARRRPWSRARAARQPRARRRPPARRRGDDRLGRRARRGRRALGGARAPGRPRPAARAARRRSTRCSSAPARCAPSATRTCSTPTSARAARAARPRPRSRSSRRSRARARRARRGRALRRGATRGSTSTPRRAGDGRGRGARGRTSTASRRARARRRAALEHLARRARRARRRCARAARRCCARSSPSGCLDDLLLTLAPLLGGRRRARRRSRARRCDPPAALALRDVHRAGDHLVLHYAPAP